MISLEKLTEFTHDGLRYKPTIKIISYEILPGGLNSRGWIELQFDNGKGEVVSADRFYNWLNEKREEKLSKLLK